MTTRKGNKYTDQTGGEQAEMHTKLDRILETNEETKTILQAIQKRLDSTDIAIRSITADLHEQRVQINKHDVKIKQLERKPEEAMNEIDQLENRSRRDNLLLNLPECIEGEVMIECVINITSVKLKLKLFSQDVQRVHRVGTKSASIVAFKLSSFQTKIKILQAQAQAQLGKRDDQDQIRFMQDYSAKLRNTRKEFYSIRKKLNKANLKSQLRYPATLWVWKDDKKIQKQNTRGSGRVTNQRKSSYPKHVDRIDKMIKTSVG